MAQGLSPTNSPIHVYPCILAIALKSLLRLVAWKSCLIRKSRFQLIGGKKQHIFLFQTYSIQLCPVVSLGLVQLILCCDMPKHKQTCDYSRRLHLYYAPIVAGKVRYSLQLDWAARVYYFMSRGNLSTVLHKGHPG